MADVSYEETRERLTTYFDDTAADQWARLTSDEPVGRVRATVRAGRDEMRSKLLSWLPHDMRGARLLDAGCGTGALATIAAARGADVVAVDVSSTLIALAADRAPSIPGEGSITFLVGDMADPDLGFFDYVVGMDSLIHYEPQDIASTLGKLAGRTRRSVLFTFAPKTPALTVMHAVGRIIPKSDTRAPFIRPVSESHMRYCIEREESLDRFEVEKTQRISSGFYKSQAMEIRRR
ncbi:MAG: magnesium protoporphyrin IX methyltransferase [Pseudomonadota bacterium]